MFIYTCTQFCNGHSILIHVLYCVYNVFVYCVYNVFVYCVYNVFVYFVYNVFVYFVYNVFVNFVTLALYYHTIKLANSYLGWGGWKTNVVLTFSFIYRPGFQCSKSACFFCFSYIILSKLLKRLNKAKIMRHQYNRITKSGVVLVHEYIWLTNSLISEIRLAQLVNEHTL